MRLSRSNYYMHGDTIIEVMFAVTVFAMIAVGCITIMNQGIATTQRALEVTLVRQQIDSQAEAIRYIHTAYVTTYHKGATVPTGPAAEWLKMKDKLSASGKGASVLSNFGETTATECPATAPGEKPFIINAHTATIWSAVPTMSPPTGGSLPAYSQVIYKAAPDTDIDQAYGIWIEAIPSDSSTQTGFIDFHIRACWSGSGSSVPVTLGTIVRLYDPR
jgi:type II secretory pathway pseudopilin PulG